MYARPRRAACTRSARRRRLDGTTCTWPSTMVHTGVAGGSGREFRSSAWRTLVARQPVRTTLNWVTVVKGCYDGEGPSRRGVTAHFHFSELRGVHQLPRPDSFALSECQSFNAFICCNRCTMLCPVHNADFLCEREGASCYIVDTSSESGLRTHYLESSSKLQQLRKLAHCLLARSVVWRWLGQLLCSCAAACC